VKLSAAAMPTTETFPTFPTFTVYPNPSSGTFSLSTGNNSPVKVYSMSGEIIYTGLTGDCFLNAGTYIIEQDNQRTKVVIQ
jgi:hypothetical protein